MNADEVNVDSPAIGLISITDTHENRKRKHAHLYADIENGYKSRERSSKMFITRPGTAIRTKANAVRKASSIVVGTIKFQKSDRYHLGLDATGRPERSFDDGLFEPHAEIL